MITTKYLKHVQISQKKNVESVTFYTNKNLKKNESKILLSLLSMQVFLLGKNY